MSRLSHDRGPRGHTRRQATRGAVRWQALAACALSSLVMAALAWSILRARARPSSPTIELVASDGVVESLLEGRKGTARTMLGADWALELDREPIDETTATHFFGALAKGRYRYDPLAYYRALPWKGHFQRFEEHPAGGWKVNVNSHGLRGRRELDLARAARRVLVIGDSHSFGVCADNETFAARLEVLRRAETGERDVEVWNAAQGGYNPYNYLGTVESMAELRPVLVILVLYGGNDFSGSMGLERYFHGRGPPRPSRCYPTEEDCAATPTLVPFLGQEGSQVAYFRANPEDERVAVLTTIAIARETERCCAAWGGKLLCAYLPPPLRAQPGYYDALVEPALRWARLGSEDLALSDRMADDWLEAVAALGIPTLDLRATLSASQQPCYWRKDLHLNLLGHELVAKALLGPVNALLR